jgi:hypothetical protein
MITNPESSKQYGKANWLIKFTDEHIKQAATEWNPVHKDAPTTQKICELASSLPWPASEMIDLNWLRNRYVGLRKAGYFK